MILLIDNYDSFTYNLVQLCGSLNPDIKVIRNDESDVSGIRSLNPSHIILSPGPGRPKDAGICEDVIRKLQGELPILGVCLGHQAICEVFGAAIVHGPKPMHGKQSLIYLESGCPLFAGLPGSIPAARYHSLVADRETVPDCLTVTARDEGGQIMAVQHKEAPIYGLQFHPESILTPNGSSLMKNFLTSQSKRRE